MNLTEKVIGGVGIVSIVTGAMWLGKLEQRVEYLEKRAEQLTLGPRGQNCQQIVEKLVNQPSNEALRKLAEEWGCSNFAASTGPADDVAEGENEWLGHTADQQQGNTR